MIAGLVADVCCIGFADLMFVVALYDICCWLAIVGVLCCLAFGVLRSGFSVLLCL